MRMRSRLTFQSLKRRRLYGVRRICKELFTRLYRVPRSCKENVTLKRRRI